jgi:TonB-dependent starch-binding outer membrane protein SusC
MMESTPMKWAKSLVLLLTLIVAPSAVMAQQTGRVAGVVSDSASGQPIPNATVSIVGTKLAAVTSSEGRYSIVNVPAGSAQVRVQRLGYGVRTQSVTVVAGQTQPVNFAMAVQAQQLQAVVAVGYGSQNLRDVTGSVSAVTTEALERAPIVSVDQMLQGTSPGVQVTTASSEPGGAMSVRIRGTGSLTGNTEPLYVIDGFPIENDIEGSSVGTGGRVRTTPANPLVTLNPSDIESISILKDASATAIYGARGANGVVIITTKQGRGTKPQFTIDTYTGQNQIAKRYDMLDAAGYMTYANTYGQNSSTPYTPFPTAVRDSILASGTNTDWQDEIFRTGTVRNLQMSVRGATQAASPTRYSISGGGFSQDGVVIGSGLRRLSGRMSLNQSIGSRIEFGGTLSASQARSKAIPTGGTFNSSAGTISAALQYVPILPVKRADGTYSYINTDLNKFSTLLDAPTTPNPVSLAMEVRDSLSDTRMLSNVFGQFELLQGLDARVSLGADYANRWRYTYYPRTTLRGSQANGEALRSTATTGSWLNENTLTYRRQFGMHNLNVVGGYTRQKTDIDGENMSNTNFVSDITGYFDIGSGAQEGGPSVGSRRSSQTLESFLGRVNYSLLDRYLFTGTYRRDGSSRFAANHKWGAFPSAAFAWRASSEPFFADIKQIDDLKFRVSWGEVGNPSIPPYGSLAALNDQGYSFGGTQQAGYYPSTVANPELTWETTRQMNYGVDFAFLDRFTLTADYYDKQTRDLLLRFRLPIESGFQSVLVNRGRVDNNGYEVGLDAQIFNPSNKNDFNWRANVNFSRNRNKVVDLGGVDLIEGDAIAGGDYSSGGTRIEVGKPLGYFYGFVSGGVIRDSIAASKVTHKNISGGTFKAGDMLILDIAGKDSSGVQVPDGLISSADMTMIGDPTPDFNFGLTNTFRFRGVELSGLLQGQRGGKILNVNRARIEASPRVNVTRERFENSWTPTNMDAVFPRVNENPNIVSNFFTSSLLEDASYLRLRTVTLSYVVPSRLLERGGMSGARVYVTGTNLWTKTEYTGFDPDVSSQSVSVLNRGIDIGAYPLSKGVIVGINFNY